MAFEKVKEFFTGKDTVERQQERAAMAIIRRQAKTAALQERRSQAIRIAKEREVIAANRQLEQIRQNRRPMGSGFFGGISSYYGGAKPPQQTTTISRKVRRKGKRKIITITRQVQAPVSQPIHFDVLGGGSSNKKNNLFGI